MKEEIHKSQGFSIFFLKKEREQQLKASSFNFLGRDAARVYNFETPSANSKSNPKPNLGIISLNGYFKQSDFDYFFTQMKIDTSSPSPPKINIAFVNNAQFDFNSSYYGIVENYLDIEIVTSILSPAQANVTFYIAPNSYQSLYDAMTLALQQNDVVTLSWSGNETDASAYWQSFQALLVRYKHVPFFVASGDYGDNQPFGVLFPASCPNAICK